MSEPYAGRAAEQAAKAKANAIRKGAYPPPYTPNIHWDEAKPLSGPPVRYRKVKKRSNAFRSKKVT